jgi:site-specific recombinase XerD
MKALYAQFLKEKEYLTGVSPRTIKYYQWLFNSWDHHIGAFPDKLNIKEWVIKLSESGVSVFTINSYIRGFNSFLTWLHENERISDHLKIKTLKEGQKSLRVFSDDQLKRLLSFKPKTFAERRVYAMFCLALDCGARIDEIITLTKSNVNL